MSAIDRRIARLKAERNARRFLKVQCAINDYAGWVAAFIMISFVLVAVSMGI